MLPDEDPSPPVFRRGYSRVFYASEWRKDECWDVAGLKDSWDLLLSAPAGGPPSHRSQDSGFSDSESEASPQSGPRASPPPGLPAHTSTPKSSRARSSLCTRLSRASRPKRADAASSPPTDHRSSQIVQDPVQRWLYETREATDTECMTTLQGKAIASRLCNAEYSSRVANARDAIRLLQQRAHVISAEFAKLCQHMERGSTTKAPAPLAQNLAGHVGEFVRGYRARSTDSSGEEDPDEAGRLAKNEAALLAACDRLQTFCNSDQETLDKDQLAGLLAALGHAFTRLVDRVLSHEIKSLVCVLEQASPVELQLRAALAGLAALSQEGSHLPRLVVRCGAVRALLALCLDTAGAAVRLAALRLLTILCSDAEAIRQLDQSGGIEVLTDMLAEPGVPEQEKCEAVSVLTQATAPGLEGRLVLASVCAHLDTLVSSISKLASTTENTETLLLTLAALANLSCLQPCPALLVGHLDSVLAAVRRPRDHVSMLFVYEQAATLLANLAAVPEARDKLAKGSRTVVALLCFLQLRPSPVQRAAEIIAAERVQQKSAIALSRLCTIREVAERVLDLQGAERLVRLCKDERERNHSDAVLVACLAALRKVVSHCGPDAVHELGAQDLVTPRLLDSFLLYSSRQESYV